ncbi:hypothetical protein BHM03_00034862 [Ensete ventricosum]|nr:hypothetical protein BHM03_00034862 [Ensete ventricosum]
MNNQRAGAGRGICSSSSSAPSVPTIRGRKRNRAEEADRENWEKPREEANKPWREGQGETLRVPWRRMRWRKRWRGFEERGKG